MKTTGALLDAWLHRGEPGVVGRPALATRAATGWAELSYSELDRTSRRVAVWLAGQGVGVGERVAIVGAPGVEWVTALFGVWRRGAVAVPLDTMLGAGELRSVLQRARPAAVIGTAQAGEISGSPPPVVLAFDRLGTLDDGPDPDVTRNAGEAALIAWTSGTDGAPKGVVLSLANIAYVVDEGLAAHSPDRDDRWLSVLPLNHLLELSCGLLPALATGACFAFAATTSPPLVAAAVAERQITRMTVVPLLLHALMDTVSLGDGRLTLHCGGAPLDPAVARRFWRLGVPVYTGYGLTETAPTVTMNTPAACRVDSVGRPLTGTEVRISGDGEVLVRSPGVMAGYWDDEALTTSVVDPDGWLHTGDLGHLDDEGFLYLTGRTKSQIVLASGKKVQPEEVERALAAGSLLAEACVVGWTPPTPVGGRALGEQVCAVIVAAPSLVARCSEPRTLTRAVEDEVARLTAGLAAFKRPSVVRVVTGELPRTAKRSVRRSEVVRLLTRN
ncbi:MAG: class I adenylate-forming enzyme family protein [Acidimicrobiales bacterium]